MTSSLVLWLLFVGGLVVLPGSAVLALRWAAQHGEFRNFQKIALSIFDEDEPVGEMTDYFPGRDGKCRGRPRDEATPE